MRPLTPSEQEDFEALRGGDDSALNRLIARWQRPLLRFAWRFVHNQADAYDLVTETFVRLYQRCSQLRPESNVSAWLFTTLTNLCHNHHRHQRRHPTISLDAITTEEGHSDEWSATPTHGPGDESGNDAAIAALTAAVDRLPPEFKTVVLLHYFEKLSYREIGAIVGCSERGIETRLYRARQRLRAELQCTQEAMV